MADTIVLLHGANGAREEMLPLARVLRATSAVFAPNWLGHGGRAPPGPGYGVAAILDDLERMLDEAGIDRCILFGYCVGGALALALAAHRPERVSAVATLASRAAWPPRAMAHLLHLADPARLTRPGNPRAAELAAAHHPTDWRLVNAANRRLFATLADAPELGEAAARRIGVPGLVLNGDADPLVSVAESHALAACFATWRLGLFPGSAHPLAACPIDDIAAALTAFARDVAAAQA